MLIVSKFHDYYDVIQRHGVDKGLVYRRETSDGGTIDLGKTSGLGQSWKTYLVNSGGHLSLETSVFPVIFCGTYYERAVCKAQLFSGTPRQIISFISATKEESEQMALDHFNVKGSSEPVSKTYDWADKASMRKNFEMIVSSRDWSKDHCREGTPVFALRFLNDDERKSFGSWSTKLRVVKDPILKDLRFFEVLGPYDAYQKIAEYLGGVMGLPGRPMVKLSDKEIHQKHGFDKWSFRKMPTA